MPANKSTLEPRNDPAAGKKPSLAESATSETSIPVSGEDMDTLANSEEFDTLQRDLDQALAKADEHWKLYLGAHAEMENLRKRTERDVQNAHKFALERFFNELLPVRDSLEMGLAAADETTNIAKLREGVDLTLKQLTAAM